MSVLTHRAPSSSCSASCKCVNCKCGPACQCEEEDLVLKEHTNKLSVQRLFFARKFITHRLTGLLYLVQFVVSWHLLVWDMDSFHKSPLWWSLPLTGLLQAIVASLTFTFLPKQKANPGYWGDKSAMSYAFVCENIFFAGLLFFQALYMSPLYKSLFSQPVMIVLECIGVFLPYTIVRPLFPKTHFRDTSSTDNSRSEQNKRWYEITTAITSMFYLFAKHFVGLFLNYVRFLDRVPFPRDSFTFHFMLLSGGAATTISMFLHTLRFKGYLQGKTSFSLYMVSYTMCFVSWWFLRGTLAASLDVLAVAVIGLLLNRFGGKIGRITVFDLYQVLITGLFVARRFNLLPDQMEWVLPHSMRGPEM